MKHFLDASERKRALAQGQLRCRCKVSARVKQAELCFTLVRALLRACKGEKLTPTDTVNQGKRKAVCPFINSSLKSNWTRSWGPNPKVPQWDFFFILKTGSASFRFCILINPRMSTIYEHKQFMTTSVLICGGITAMRKYFCITDYQEYGQQNHFIWTWFDTGRIWQEPDWAPDRTNPSYFNTTARYYIITVILKNFT